MRATGGLVLAAVLALRGAATAEESATPPAAGEEKKPSWEFNASLYGYFPPEDRHYASPIVIANHGALHLEARYNYEGWKTGSA